MTASVDPRFCKPERVAEGDRCRSNARNDDQPEASHPPEIAATILTSVSSPMGTAAWKSCSVPFTEAP